MANCRAGTSGFIADRLYGRPIWQVPERRLRRAASTFADEGIRPGAVYGPADLAALGRAFETASALSTNAQRFTSSDTALELARTYQGFPDPPHLDR